MHLNRGEYQQREADLRAGDPDGFTALANLYHDALEKRFIKALLRAAGSSPKWSNAVTKHLPRDTNIPTGGKPGGWKDARTATHCALVGALKPTGDHLMTPLHPILFPGGIAALTEDEIDKSRYADGELPVEIAAVDVARALIHMESVSAIRSAVEAFIACADPAPAAAAEPSAAECGSEPVGGVAPKGVRFSPEERRACEAEIKQLRRDLKSAEDKAAGFRSQLSSASQKIAAATKQLASAEDELSALSADRDGLRKQLNTTIEALTKTDAEKDAAKRGLESVTAERDALRSQVSEIEDELGVARYWKERYELHIRWQDERFEAAQRQVAARDELLATFGLDNLTEKLETIGASISMMTALFETMQSYKTAVDEQKARQEAELAERERAHAEAEEENRQREAMWEDRAEEHRASRLQRLQQYEDGLVEGGAPDRVIIDGHNLLYQYTEGADEAESRAKMLDLLDAFVDRFCAVSPETVVTVVFDSQHNASAVAPRESGLRVEYALNDKSAERGTSGADARIREMLEEGGRGNRYIVLSNDRTDVHSAADEAAAALNLNVTAQWNYAFATYLRDLDLLGAPAH